MLLYMTPALLVLLLACSQNNTNKENSTGNANDMANNDNAERQKMIANNERVNRAIETGNFDGTDTLWADDIVDHSGPGGKEVRGKDSLKAMLMLMSKSMKDIKIDTKVSAYDHEKGYLFSLSHFTATTTAPMNGMPANTKIDMNSIDLIKIVNGKATEHWVYENPQDMMKMMSRQKNGKK